MDIPTDLLIDITNANITVKAFDANKERKAMYAEAYRLFRKAVDDIKVIKSRYLCTVASSFAKDSNVTLMAALQAHVELMQEEAIPKDTPFLCHSVDTCVENPLVTINCWHSVRGLKNTCKTLGINLELTIGKPPLASQWAALYASGLKILCSARANSDCSVIMKVDTAAIIEKEIQKKYSSQNIVTLIGSRHLESTSRSQSISTMTPARSAEELLDMEQLTFAPIQDMSDDDIWSLIKMAKPMSGRPMIESEHDVMGYCSNTFLYHLYKDSTSKSSCPTTAKKTAGEAPGACGASARTGCFVCLKSTRDRSGEAAASTKRHRAYALNANKVRNWLQFVSSDIQYRSYLSKALDYSNDEAICLQPNTPSGEVLSQMIWYLSMLTFDEKNRAATFKALVEEGRAHEDATISDIQTDETLSDQEKEELIAVYTEFATKPLIEPINLELAIYLSAIHARDGIAVPKFHALMIYLAVEGGERIEYPEVNLDEMVESPIPSPIMAIPAVPFESYNAEFNSELAQLGFDREFNCQITESYVRTRFTESDVKRLLPEYVSQVKNGYMTVQGLKPTPLFTISGKANRKRKARNERSERRVVRRKGKIEKTSHRVNSYAFKARPGTSLLEESSNKVVYGFVPHHAKEPRLDAIDFVAMTENERFGVNLNQYFELMQFELPRLKKQWREECAMNEKLHNTVFVPSSTKAFNWLVESNILMLSQSAKVSSLRIMSRTNYFRSVGLHSLSNEQLVKMFNQRKAPKDTQILQLVDMDTYRSMKAKNLIKLKEQRNQSRTNALAAKALRKTNESAFQLELMEQMHQLHHDHISEAVFNMAVSTIMLNNGIKVFDHKRFDLLNETSNAYLKMIQRHFISSRVFTSYFRSNSEYRCPVTEANLEQAGRDFFTQSVNSGLAQVQSLKCLPENAHSSLVLSRLLIESYSSDINTELDHAIASIKKMTGQAQKKAAIAFSANLASIDVGQLRL